MLLFNVRDKLSCMYFACLRLPFSTFPLVNSIECCVSGSILQDKYELVTNTAKFTVESFLVSARFTNQNFPDFSRISRPDFKTN